MIRIEMYVLKVEAASMHCSLFSSITADAVFVQGESQLRVPRGVHYVQTLNCCKQFSKCGV